MLLTHSCLESSITTQAIVSVWPHIGIWHLFFLQCRSFTKHFMTSIEENALPLFAQKLLFGWGNFRQTRSWVMIKLASTLVSSGFDWWRVGEDCRWAWVCIAVATVYLFMSLDVRFWRDRVFLRKWGWGVNRKVTCIKFFLCSTCGRWKVLCSQTMWWAQFYRQVEFCVCVQNIAQSPHTCTRQICRITRVSKSWPQIKKRIPMAKYMPVFFCHYISEWQNTLLWHKFLILII